MKRIVALLSIAAIATLIACSSAKYYESPQKIEYKSVFHSGQFFSSLPYVAEQNKYTIIESNTEKGTAMLRRTERMGDMAVEILIQINFDEKTDMVSLTPKALVSNDDNQSVQYYDEKVYNKKFEDLYLPMIKGLKEFCTKTSFPNRP